MIPSVILCCNVFMYFDNLIFKLDKVFIIIIKYCVISLTDK